MARPGRFGRQLRSLLFKASVEEEVDAELEFHVAMRRRDLEARGMPPEQAEREARAALGDVPALRASMRTLGHRREASAARGEYIAEFLQDVRFSLRQMLKAPGFALVAAGTLGLGIAGTTAIFSAVRAVVLAPWPFAHPDRTVFVQEWWQEQGGSVSVGNYTDLKAMLTTFEALGAETFASYALGDGEAERAFGGRVTHDYFRVFGIAPLLGRTFLPEEDAPGRDRVVVLSEPLWRRRFEADRAIIGRQITINRSPYTVIGVMPASFDPMLAQEQLWVPAAFTPEQIAQHDEHYLRVFGLLKDRVSLEQANGDVDRAMAELQQRFPRDNAGRSGNVLMLSPLLIGESGNRLWVVLGAVGLVLLIACGNVANLLLARGAARSREIALRAALGAGRGRLLRQLLTESFVLSMIASLLGVALAAALVQVLKSSAPQGAIPRLEQTRVDLPILFFALGCGLLSTMFSGWLPAWRVARQDLQTTLRAGGKGAARASGDGLRSGLITIEVALAVTLLAGAGLLVRSAVNLYRTPTGIDLTNVVAARLALPAEAYASPDVVARTFGGLAESLRAAPGIEHAAIVSVSPLSGNGSSNGLIPEGRPLEPSSSINSMLRIVTPGYFETVRVRLVSGRLIDERDVRGAQRVMLVSEALARVAWPGENPIGKRIACCEGTPEDPMWKTVVGVVGDVRSNGPMVDPAPEFYLPLAQAPEAAWRWNRNTMSIVARGPSTDAVMGALRSTVRELDAQLPLYGVATARELFDQTVAPARFNTMLLSSLALLGLALAVAGIYSVVAYFVSLRTHEIGVRMALGARAGDVLRLMMMQGMRPVLAGLLLGAAGAFAATRTLRSALFGVSTTDPATLASVGVLLVAVALVATIIPARRATRVQPVRALSET